MIKDIYTEHIHLFLRKDFHIYETFIHCRPLL